MEGIEKYESNEEHGKLSERDRKLEAAQNALVEMFKERMTGARIAELMLMNGYNLDGSRREMDIN